MLEERAELQDGVDVALGVFRKAAEAAVQVNLRKAADERAGRLGNGGP